MPLVISMAIIGILTMLTAPMADYGWQFVSVCRAIQGFLQGFSFPCFHTLASRWVHPIERGTLASTANSGPTIGTLIMLSTGGFIATSSLGWPAIFYISGGCAVVWSVVLFVFCRNTPADYKTISIEELAFIESMPGNESRKTAMPWIAILTSKAYWGIQVAQCAECWSMATLLTAIPSYMHGVLQVHMQSVSNMLANCGIRVKAWV